MRPLCFVLMPFGKKPAGDGRMVDFDAVYAQLIKPAIEAAGLEPLRADKEMTGGLIHKAMFERLILCPYAVADMTTANANVFYELGVRHATRQWATVPVFANGWGQLPFDVNGLRAVPYQLADGGVPAGGADLAAGIAALQARLQAARDTHPATDSPLYELVQDFPNIQHDKTDVFRQQVRYAADLKAELAKARDARDAAALQAIEARLAPLADADAAVVVDLYLSYRAVEHWDGMIALVPRMGEPLARTVMVQEQLGFALNRAKRHDEAARVLQAVIKQHGASSETCGLLGRVHKDLWTAAQNAGDAALARGQLKKAIATYLQGFEADFRDPYPGINAVTLMEQLDPPDPRQTRLLPVVTYAAQRRMAPRGAPGAAGQPAAQPAASPNYWDHATLLELAVLARDEPAAQDALADTLAAVREPWEPKTTANNLAMISQARTRRGEAAGWVEAIGAALLREAEKQAARKSATNDKSDKNGN